MSGCRPHKVLQEDAWVLSITDANINAAPVEDIARLRAWLSDYYDRLAPYFPRSYKTAFSTMGKSATLASVRRNRDHASLTVGQLRSQSKGLLDDVAVELSVGFKSYGARISAVVNHDSEGAPLSIIADAV